MAASVVLTPDARTVGRARQVLRQALIEAGFDELVERATLAVSELVTNAFVHAGTDVTLVVAAAPGAVRVEVGDGGTHLPMRRRYADTAGTGRG